MTTLPRLATCSIVVLLLAAACGSDGESSDGAETTDGSTTTTAATTDTTPEGGDGTTTTTGAASTSTGAPDGTTTTTEAAPGGATGVLAQGTVTTDGGLTTNWSLTATATSLCFEADLSHPDPDAAAVAGNGVADCLEPAGGLDSMTSGLSVDVGGVDGERSIGFLWGRVAPEVIALTIEHANGTQTEIDILDGPTDVGVFAYVVEVASIAEVQDLDAVSGTQIEGSQPIRDFLRAGPTYPEVAPPPTTPPPDYPVS